MDITQQFIEVKFKIHNELAETGEFEFVNLSPNYSSHQLNFNQYSNILTMKVGRDIYQVSISANVQLIERIDSEK